MIDFKPIALADKALFDNTLAGNTRASSEHSFATIMSWHSFFATQIAIVADCIVLAYTDIKGRQCFVQPMGNGDKIKAVRELMLYANEQKQPLILGSVSEEFYKQLQVAFDKKMQFELIRNMAEYVYLRERLTNLKGSKLQPKRNHINKFCKLYPNYHTEFITTQNASLCKELYALWLNQVSSRDEDKNELHGEQQAVNFALDNFNYLNLKGITLWVDNTMVAFAFGEMVTTDTFLTHAEKALTSYEGSYAMINKLTAQLVATEAIYINREEDLGLEHLRKAKLSYDPAFLIEKGFVVFE